MDVADPPDDAAARLEQVFANATRVVWARGRRAGLSEEDCEDLLQDVLIKFQRAWPSGSEPDNVEAWLETAVGRTIIDRIRAKDRRPTDHFGEGEGDPVSLAIAAMGSTRFASELAVRRDLLKTIFSLIPAQDALLLSQRYLHRYSAADVADELGIRVPTVEQRTARAKQKLREALHARPDLVEELRKPHPHVY